MQGCFKGKKADGKQIINDEVKHEYVVQPVDSFSENLVGDKEMIKTPKVEFSWEHDTGFLSADADYEPLNFDKDFTDH